MAISRSTTALFLLVSTFLVYLPCLHGDFLWDDDAYISQNETLRSPEGLHDIWLKPGSVQQYYPLTFTVFWVEHHLWGEKTVGYHAVNILLHSVNAILVGLVLEGLGISGAWIAAWLFALHPVMVESVAWMTELKNVLSTFFYLLAVLAVIPAKAGPPHNRRAGSPALWRPGIHKFMATLLFTCALLSKSVTVTLPASFFLISWWMRGKLEKRRAFEMLPFFVLAIGAAISTTYYEHHWVRAQGTTWAFSITDRILIAGHAFWFYLGKLFFPASLSFIYPRWPIPSPGHFSFLYPLTAAGLLAVLAYNQKKWGKLPFACLLFFAISLSPTLGFTSFYFMRYSFVADHFQYVASIGIFAWVGWIFSKALRKLEVPLPSPAGIVVVSLLCVNLGLATMHQSRKYVDSFHLWQDTLALNPDSAIAHHNIGIALTKSGQWNEAVAHLRTAEALDPSFPQTHLALAYFAVHAKRWEDARHQYEEAIRLGVQDPQVLSDFAALPTKANLNNGKSH